MKIDLNDKVRVKMTNEGKKKLLKHVDEVNSFLSKKQSRYRADYPKYDDEGCIEITFWELIYKLGTDAFGIGVEKPFEWIEKA